jgi:hypothetical protein
MKKLILPSVVLGLVVAAYCLAGIEDHRHQAPDMSNYYAGVLK